MVPHRGRGFTLVELLVVIAIMVLVALLMPVIWSVRNGAKLSWCQTNMRQLYTGMMNYAADFTGRLPYTKVFNWPVTKDWMGYWAPPRNDANAPHEGTLWSYMGDRKVYLCPSDTPPRSVHRGDGFGAGYRDRNPVTTHGYAIHSNDPGDTGRATHIDTYPSKRWPIMVEESAVTIEDGNFRSGGNIFASRHRMSASDAKSSYDKAGGCICFLDGRVEFFRAEAVMNAESTLFYELWKW
ncbi:MAG: prepilin-type N-terminal cleavage/methylation domain-containing protein [Planctomycetota bacterium]